MPDETAAQPPSNDLLDDLLDDLSTSDPLSGSDGEDDSDNGGDAQPDSGDQNIVYDDVDNDQYFTIDSETGDKEVLDPSNLPDSAQIETVDDHQDDSFDDELGLDDSGISTSADDPSISDSFDDMDDEE